MKPAPRIEDPRDEGRLADLVSGYMWVTTGLGGLIALMLPGAARSHLACEFAIAAFAIAWGGMSFVLAARGPTMSMTRRAGLTAAMVPLNVFALAVAGISIAMYALKRRLLLAEERQRRMAERDPLTGLHHRRAFDAALGATRSRAATSRSCCSTSTASRRSTTSMATRSATPSCARSRRRAVRPAARSTTLRAWAATSSR
jgi:hypothetical protein